MIDENTELTEKTPVDGGTSRPAAWTVKDLKPELRSHLLEYDVLKETYHATAKERDGLQASYSGLADKYDVLKARAEGKEVAAGAWNRDMSKAPRDGSLVLLYFSGKWAKPVLMKWGGESNGWLWDSNDEEVYEDHEFIAWSEIHPPNGTE